MIATVQVTPESKEREENLEKLMNSIGFQEQHISPVPYISNCYNTHINSSFDPNHQWRVYVVCNPDQRKTGRADPSGELIGGSYTSDVLVYRALEQLKEKHGHRENIGIIIEDTKNNKYFTGYLNPIQNPPNPSRPSPKLEPVFSYEELEPVA